VGRPDVHCFCFFQAWFWIGKILMVPIAIGIIATATVTASTLNFISTTIMI
jgi:hypothetical protein